MTLTPAERQLPGWHLNLTQAVKGFVELTGGSEYWTGDTQDILLKMEGALVSGNGDMLLLAATECIKLTGGCESWSGETQGCLMDMEAAPLLWHMPEEPDPYEPDPVNEGYEMSGRDCDRAAGMHFGNLNAQHP
jgi:hypothetical protein